MHIFCPNCGKHIDVSVSEIEKLEGQYVCPQCLSEINLEGFEHDDDYMDYIDDDIDQQDYAPQSQEVPELPKEGTGTQQADMPSSKSTTPPQSHNQHAPTTAQQGATDQVLRYCKKCGAFLRQGVSYCPKCGNYVKVAPPTYRGTTSTTAPSAYRSQSRSNNVSNQSTYPRNRQNNPMSNNPRKPSSSSRKTNNGTGKEASRGIFSIAGCLTFTIIVVALFFILYIIIGVNNDGLVTP